MTAVFQVKTNDKQEYYFHFVDDAGELLLLSAEYPEKSELEKVIADVRVGSLMGNQIAAGRTKAGEKFFVIKDASGQIIAKSTLYISQMSFDNALHCVKDNACVAEVVDRTADVVH
ncbi:MAG: YegP family protein [Spongiibacteraceae bacterium]